tara:strand:+ start:423 stop:773 length:351 start_codon:yes stop_codon:yes gene_type:complete
MTTSFKNAHSLDDRIKEAQKMLTKYPERIPIIVEMAEGCQLNPITKNKYLAPRDMPMSQFVFTIRKKIQLESSQAIFVLVNNQLVTSNAQLSKIYEDHRDEDGFLYMVYTSENTFG